MGQLRDDDVSVNWTVKGTVPDEGVVVKLAVGTDGGVDTTVLLIVDVYWVPLPTVKLTVCVP